jgi:hypothetical protein
MHFSMPNPKNDGLRLGLTQLLIQPHATHQLQWQPDIPSAACIISGKRLPLEAWVKAVHQSLNTHDMVLMPGAMPVRDLYTMT